MKQLDLTKLWYLYQQTWFKYDTGAELFEHFAILTACNPGSIPVATARNITNQQKLKKDLVILNLRFSELDAGSADFSYSEPSYAVNCSLKQAMDLSRRYQQNALFWVQQDRLWLIPVNMLKQMTTEVGRFSERTVMTGIGHT